MQIYKEKVILAKYLQDLTWKDICKVGLFHVTLRKV